MYSYFYALSRFMACLGGATLFALVILICLSIVGRSLNGILHSDIMQSYASGPAEWLLSVGIGPINGDFELVEAGMAFAIFAFLPLCQISGSHAYVDVFTSRMSKRVNRVLRLVSDILFAFVLVLIAVQLYDGMLSKVRTGQTTFLIEFPIWWAYALSFVGAVAAAIVSVYIAVTRIREMATGRTILPSDSGAEH